MESKANQKLSYGDGFKFLNKISETGYKVVYLAIWLVSLLETAVTHYVANHVRLSRGSVRKKKQVRCACSAPPTCTQCLSNFFIVFPLDY